MATIDDPPAWTGDELDDNPLIRARTALAEALTELHRLTREPPFGNAEHILAGAGNAVAGSNVDVDTVCKLRDWSADHQRVAIELEAAARCCRLIEREINQRVDALLAGRPAGHPEAGRPDMDVSQAAARWRIGPDGWLGLVFHRARASPPRPGERPLVIRPPDGHRGALPLVAAPAQPGPEEPEPAADIAALALGPLEVRVAGQRVLKWNSLKARAVFQYLLVHQDRPTRRDVLMALQWPDHSHNSARNNLNVALYSLRNTLGPGQAAQPILYRDGCYILNPELDWWVDRNEFLSAFDDAQLARRAGRPEKVVHSYHKAIRLYRGPLFEDDGGGEWYLPEQRRLRDLYGQALEQVAAIHFQLGELPEALQFGQLGLSNDPCSEATHRLLMRCYASRREQQLVSRQYQACATTLREELGVSPCEETTQLLHELI